MGRIVKAPGVSGERYTVPLPSGPPVVSDAALETDEYGFAAAGLEDTALLDAPLHAPESPLPRIDPEDVERRASDLLERAAADAEALLAEAHQRARALVEDAAARVAQIADAARAEGQRAGYDQGKVDADADMAETLASMRNLLEMARAERHKLIASAEPEIVKLAMGIAERVLHQQVAIDREVVVEMARAAIGRLVERDQITVRVNPADIDHVRERKDDLSAIDDVGTLRFVEDNRVDRGGVVVESDGGSIDARIATQVGEAKRVLHIEDDVVVEPADVVARTTIYPAAV